MQQFSPDYLKEKLASINAFSFSKKTIICVSGGADSMALMHAASQVLKNITVVTVDHKMRASSAKEAKFVSKFCQKLSLPHITLQNELPIPSSNIEDYLRKIRYDLITKYARKNRITQALLAHHLNDNIETFFMRLERGSGLKGLACMDEVIELNEVKFFRPLLDLPKASLLQYLKKNKVKNIEDESNKNIKFTRNNIRQFLENMNDAEIFSQRVGQSIKALAEAEKIISTLENEIRRTLVKSEKDHLTINKDKFFSGNPQIVLRIFKQFLMEQGTGIIPRFDRLQLLYNNMKLANFKKQTLNGCIITIKKDRIIITKEAKALKGKIK